MTTKEAALYLGISVFYLRNMRQLLHNHDGPKYTLIRYRNGMGYNYTREDLDAWAESHKWRKSKDKAA